jgi:hypothetical protein
MALIVGGLLLAAVSGCDNRSSSHRPMLGHGGDDVIELDNSQLTPDTLTGVLVSRSPMFGKIEGIVSNGHMAWIMDKQGDPYLHRVDLSTGKVTSLGRRGEGPGELRGLWSLGLWSDSLFLFDGAIGRLLVAPIASDNLADATTIDMRSTLGSLLLNILPVAGGHLWLQRANAETPYVIISRQGQVTRHIPIAPVASRRASLTSRQEALWQATSCVMPDGEGVVIAYLDVARLDFVDTGTGRTHSLAIPTDEEPAVRAREDGTLVLDLGRIYYRGCVASGHQILALFSGRRRGAYPGTEASLGRFIHVFNHNGAYVGAFILDHAVSQIALAPDELTLYATIDDRGEVWKYTLPDGESR